MRDGERANLGFQFGDACVGAIGIDVIVGRAGAARDGFEQRLFVVGHGTGEAIRGPAVEDEAENQSTHQQRNDERRRFGAARKNRFRARAPVEHDRREIGAQLYDERILGIDALRLRFRPAAGGRAFEGLARARREKECRRVKAEHANGLVDQKLDQRLFRRRVGERAGCAAQSLF